MDDNLIRLGLIDDDEIVLDEAELSLALLDHLATDLQPYEVLLGELAARLEVVGAEATSAHERADALSHVLCGEFGFVGDSETYDDPANADLIRVIDRRRGLPVSLSILYVAAARRLGWSADVLDVPGHVLVLVGDAAAPVTIDPFRGGVLITSQQLARMLTSSEEGVRATTRHVAAMPNRAVLVRLLLNQASRAEQAGASRRALELYGRMTTMAPGYGHVWWERARLELIEGDVSAARTTLASMLEITKEADTRERVLRTLASLRSSQKPIK